MFEETNVNAHHTDRIRGRLKTTTYQVTFSGGNGTATLDTANSSPDALFTGNTTTFSLTYAKGTFVQFEQPVVTGGTTITGRISAFNAGAGTATLELSAQPADGVRLWLTVNVGRTG
jgi:hypothetical protein